MRNGKKVIAIVPARSGSKGIPDKNMQCVGGLSLIARAGQVLSAPECAWIDRRILSTDSKTYAEEGMKHGLECPFLRPESLSGDGVGSVETVQHAWRAAEEHFSERYDVMLLLEPTCPLRRPADINETFAKLIASGALSAVAVSRLDMAHHPKKALRISDGKLRYYSADGASVVTRQSLEPLYFRSGACYAATRECLFEKGAILCDETVPYLIERPLANIDEFKDLAYAEFLENQSRDE